MEGRAVVGLLKGRPDTPLLCWTKQQGTEWLAGLPLLLGDTHSCTLETFESAVLVFKFPSLEALRDQFISYDDGPQVQQRASQIYGLFLSPVIGTH